MTHGVVVQSIPFTFVTDYVASIGLNVVLAWLDSVQLCAH